jgi:predicted ribonuclease YlaK
VCEEIDNILHNSLSEEKKYKARQARNAIKQSTTIEFSTYSPTFTIPEGWDSTYNKNDNKLLAICKDLNVTLVTNDIAMQIKAESIGVKWEEYSPQNKNLDEYKGYKEVLLGESDMAYFYENLSENTFNCLINEYLVIKDSANTTRDIRRWTEKGYVEVFKKNIKTIAFGDKIKSKDEFQQMAIDSMLNNTMTIISGKAGSGKTLLSLMLAIHLIESGKYDRLVILFNPTKTRGSTEMGYYSGSLIEKAMSSSIGNILTTKFGDRFAVDLLLQQNKIRLIPMSDCRGMEINDNEILFITECQNTSIDLLKLCLSRASQGCKIFLEGDYHTQVDDRCFENRNNGMKRAIDVLKGEDIFGYVELKNVYRSKIASLVEKL